MTLEEFKKLKVGDEIVFKNSDVYKLTNHITYPHPNIPSTSNLIGHMFQSNKCSIEIQFTDTSYISLAKNGMTTIAHFDSFNISKIDKSEKEQIEEQIKTLQDKLKEIEQNDVVAIAKTLVDGDFIEIVWYDGRSVIHKVFGITETQIGHYFDVFKDTKSDWYIPFREISKLFIRKDIKEAYEKFSATLNLKSTH